MGSQLKCRLDNKGLSRRNKIKYNDGILEKIYNIKTRQEIKERKEKI